ncbi:MAG: hypothetical protein J6W96_02375 [Alphaproteobacteria bacterium]|nr:hypothetical protein [Alphaproteobacteria bacterium]
MLKIILSFCFSLIFSFSALAEPKFTADISVDETAANVTEAKQKAMSKAKRDGLNEVILGISTEESVKEINKLNDNQLEHFITEIMVLMEKTSDVRYIAKLRISVDENLLKAYMKENDLPLVLGGNSEITLIPLLEKEDGSLDLWGDDNFWRQALLNKLPIQKGNLKINLIDKNLGNIAMIKAERAYDLADGEYNELINFNRANALYVAKYSLKDHRVYVKAYPSRLTQNVDIDSSSPSDMLDRIIPFFKDTQKQTYQPAHYSIEQINVIYNYSRLSQWTNLKQILDNNPQVQNIRISSMANGQVHFSFEYGGIIEKLQGNLDMSGYKMRLQGEHYVIN